MKTPDEIKKGLANAEHVQRMAIVSEDGSCETNYGVLVGYVQRDDIVACIDNLVQRLAQAERERDALRQCTCGDTVYKLIKTKDGSGFIVEEQLCGFHYIDPPKQRSNKRGSYMIAYHETSGHISHLPVSEVGKTIFSTYEDAKKALDERRGVCEENSKEG